MKKILFVTAFLLVCAFTLPAVSQDSSVSKRIVHTSLKVGDVKVFNYQKPMDVTPTEELKNYLDSAVAFLNNHPKAEIRIIGHSDHTGTLQENTERSKVRAAAAKNYLVSKGISAGRIFDRGVGATDPLALGNSEEINLGNRRIEISIVGK